MRGGNSSKVTLSTTYGSFGGGLAMWVDKMQRELINNVNSIYPHLADCWYNEITQNLNENIN
jgi:cephalosporin-C deacetylase-like acetyl esterase